MKKYYAKPIIKVIDLRQDFSLFSGCRTFAGDTDSCY